MGTADLDGMAPNGAPEAIPIHTDSTPLRVDQAGVIRIGNSRITLDLIVEQYENGMTPEDMVRAYDTLQLADAHAVIAYYLRHREEVLAYLTRRVQEAEALRVKIEAEHPRVSREELLTRRTSAVGELASIVAGLAAVALLIALCVLAPLVALVLVNPWLGVAVAVGSLWVWARFGVRPMPGFLNGLLCLWGYGTIFGSLLWCAALALRSLHT